MSSEQESIIMAFRDLKVINSKLKSIVDIGPVERVQAVLETLSNACSIFLETHPNPVGTMAQLVNLYSKMRGLILTAVSEIHWWSKVLEVERKSFQAENPGEDLEKHANLLLISALGAYLTEKGAKLSPELQLREYSFPATRWGSFLASLHSFPSVGMRSQNLFQALGGIIEDIRGEIQRVKHSEDYRRKYIETFNNFRGTRPPVVQEVYTESEAYSSEWLKSHNLRRNSQAYKKLVQVNFHIFEGIRAQAFRAEVKKYIATILGYLKEIETILRNYQQLRLQWLAFREICLVAKTLGIFYEVDSIISEIDFVLNQIIEYKQKLSELSRASFSELERKGAEANALPPSIFRVEEQDIIRLYYKLSPKQEIVALSDLYNLCVRELEDFKPWTFTSALDNFTGDEDGLLLGFAELTITSIPNKKPFTYAGREYYGIRMYPSRTFIPQGIRASDAGEKWIHLKLNPKSLARELEYLDPIESRFSDNWDQWHEMDDPFIPYAEKYPEEPIKLDKQAGELIILNDPAFLSDVIDEFDSSLQLIKDAINGEEWEERAAHSLEKGQDLEIVSKTMKKEMLAEKRFWESMKQRLSEF